MCNNGLIWLIISKYFADLSSVLIVHNSSSWSELSYHYLNATQSSFQRLSQQGHPIGLHWIDVAGYKNQSEFNEVILQHVEMNIQAFITILPRLEDFLEARYYATEHCVIRLKDLYYLFLSEGENVKEILSQDVLKLYPHHLLVEADANCDSFELWTQKFVGIDNNLDALHLDTYFSNGSFANNIELFPNKLDNLQGRTLAVSSVTYVPYVISYVVPSGAGHADNLDPTQPKMSVVYAGTEANIVLTFCELRNCTVKVVPYGNDYWGGIYENGSSDGLVGSVYRKETELGIGCIYNWYNEIFEKSTAVAKSAVPVLGPAPSRLPAYMTIILPFNKLIWSLIILSIFIGSITMHGIKYFVFCENHRDVVTKPTFDHQSTYSLTLFQIVAIFFQQSFSQSKLDRFAAQFFLSTLLLAGITLENTYSGQLKSLLTIPILTDPVDTIEKFAATGWHWGAPSMAWIYSIQFSEFPLDQTMVSRFDELTHEQLRNLSFSGQFGLGVERLHHGTYNFGDYVRDGALDQMIITKDTIYYDWSLGITIRGWPLMELFNKHILWCLEHGLHKYWEKKYVFEYLDRKTEDTLASLAAGHLKKYPPANLTVANISGPLFALAIGYSFAFVVFIFEVFTRRN